ncbi:MAG: hypothetical protein Q9171_000514 [Xanthocarpia ochracea]
MRTISVPALFALGLAVRQTAATSWTDAQTYRNPSNTNNQCVGDQSKGLGFDDRSNGDLGNYGALEWQNLRCTDGLQKRTSGPYEDGSLDKVPEGFAGGRCASGTASKDVDSSPKFSCGPDQKGMSIDNIHVSTSETTEIELHYGYDNGDVCKQTETCSPAGKIIKNKQCGDARSVTVKLPDADKKDNCEVGIHSVGFNCGPASSKPPVPSATPVESTPIVSTSQETKPYPYPTTNTTTLIGSTAPSTIPESTSIPLTSTAEVPILSTTLESPITPIYSNTSISSTSPVETIPTITSVPLTSIGDSSPTTAAPGTTVPVVTTEVIVATLTTCPVTNTITSGSVTSLETTSTVSTVLVTTTSTVCTYCVPPPASTATVPIGTTSVPIETPVVPGSPETTPISSAGENSPETTISSVPIASSLTPAPVPTATQDIATTEIVFTTLTTCPVTSTITSGDTTSVQTITTVSTVISTSTSTICTQCVPPAETPTPPPAVSTPISPSTGNLPIGETSVPILPPSSPALAPPAPAPPAPYPTVLPSCMKTWLVITTCKDTADSSCYCLDAEFTKTVQECVSAWAANNSDVRGALSNLAGICADHVSNNPGIITNVPKTITLVPTPASQPPSGPSGAPIPPPILPGPVTSIPGNPVPQPPSGPSGAPIPPSILPAPVTSIPGNPVPIADSSVPSTVANSPAGATIPLPAANPVTTLSLSQPVAYACPVSQLPDGQAQAPASSCTSLLVTQVTVPQVGFETAPAAPGVTNPSVELVAGSPAPVLATATAGPVGGSPTTTFGTVVGTASAIGSTFPQGSTIPFTGSAGSTRVTGFGVLAGVIGMLFLV